MAAIIRLVIAYNFLVASSTLAAHGHHREPHYEVPAKYDFGYAVRDDYSGNDFAHQETREGYSTTGEYRVLLPDGRVQVVTYTADETGYHPVVSYEGEAAYPAHTPQPYKPAPHPHPAPYKPTPYPAPYKPTPYPAPYKPEPRPHPATLQARTSPHPDP
ncbi:nematocyst expressed protein 4-like [Macrobrachium nipponense]|uniref:nematocyst expressed protein 4-like n=1 Tax=Macrobrachium nipponense TaxID=159736 RepID=UPI0030C7A34A